MIYYVKRIKGVNSIVVNNKLALTDLVRSEFHAWDIIIIIRDTIYRTA